MTVKIILRGKEYEARPGMTLRDALLKLDVNPQSVLAVRDGVLITDEEIINDGEVVKLVAVVSGGGR